MRKIADSTVRRLSLYLRFLEEFEGRGVATVSSDALAQRGGTTSAQVRKDLSFFGSFGKRGLGYDVHELANFAMGSTPVTAHYLFASGYSDYDGNNRPSVGDRPSGGTPYLNAGEYISVRHLSADHVAAGPVTFTGIVDADNDNNGVGSVVLLTNGFINTEERNGNLLVDAIWSSGRETSPRRPARVTISVRSFSALICSATTRRISEVDSCASCGSSITPRFSSARVASSSRWMSAVAPRMSCAAFWKRSVTLASSPPISVETWA